MRKIGKPIQSCICSLKVSHYSLYKEQEAQYDGLSLDPRLQQRSNTITKATRDLSRHKALVRSLYEEGSREGTTSAAIPLETIQVYIGCFILKGKIRIYSSSITSNNLQMPDIGYSLGSARIQERTYLAARTNTNLGSKIHYRSIPERSISSTLEGSRHSPLIIICIKHCKEGSTCIPRLGSILVYLGQV